MKYPEFLKQGDTIGICAPSAGIVKEEKIIRLDYAIATLKNMGYNVIETPSVRKEENGRSASAEVRANEFMSLLENDDVKLILFATGGDFLCEMIEKLDFEKIRGLKPKWMQGYSDITGISYLFNTILEIPSMIPSMTTNELSARAGVSDAAVIRFCKSIGIHSFRLFKMELMKYQKRKLKKKKKIKTKNKILSLMLKK